MSEYEEEMCPNCVTPWKCNGPHILSEQIHDDPTSEPFTFGHSDFGVWV